MSKPEPKTSTVTVIYWNIWFKSQTDPARFRVLKKRFDELIEEHDPDAFGLNEVLISRKNGKSQLLTYLEKMGFHATFTGFSPINPKHITGSALVTKKKPKKVDIAEIGPDNVAKTKRGLDGHTIKTITASYPIDGVKDLSIAVVYLAHIVPYNWLTHLIHLKNFRKMLSEEHLRSNSIVGGDFNEFKYMFKFWHGRHNHHRKTGSYLNPTWTWHGLSASPLRANYDNILWSKKSPLSLRKFKVLDRKPSDHAPIIGVFDIDS